jgi:hypothetical protein
MIKPLCMLIPHGNRSCQEISSLFEGVEAIRSDAEAITSRIHRLMPQQTHNSRKCMSRSLLPFFGEISSYLYGTASEKDLLILQRHVKTMLAHTDKKLKMLFNNMKQTSLHK